MSSDIIAHADQWGLVRAVSCLDMFGDHVRDNRVGNEHGRHMPWGESIEELSQQVCLELPGPVEHVELKSQQAPH